MSTQADLFSDTRKEARAKVAPHITRLAAQCLAELRHQWGGATADELAVWLDRSILSIRPRITELKQAGLIFDTGRRRAARSGAGTPQAVFKAKEVV